MAPPVVLYPLPCALHCCAFALDVSSIHHQQYSLVLRPRPRRSRASWRASLQSTSSSRASRVLKRALAASLALDAKPRDEPDHEQGARGGGGGPSAGLLKSVHLVYRRLDALTSRGALAGLGATQRRPRPGSSRRRSRALQARERAGLRARTRASPCPQAGAGARASITNHH